jgi:hypothetical protein
MPALQGKRQLRKQKSQRERQEGKFAVHVKRAGRSDFKTRWSPSRLPKPEMPALQGKRRRHGRRLTVGGSAVTLFTSKRGAQEAWMKDAGGGLSAR